MKKSIKNIIITFGFILSIFGLVTLGSCGPFLEKETPCCYLIFDNNSEQRVHLAAMTIASPFKQNKELKDTIIGYIGDVYEHSRAERISLWPIVTDLENVSWEYFFKEYELDSLIIAAADTYENIALWEKQKSDSLLLKKYVFTLRDLPYDNKYVIISYP